MQQNLNELDLILRNLISEIEIKQIYISNKSGQLEHPVVFKGKLPYLEIDTIYDEQLTFFENGKVKCFNKKVIGCVERNCWGPVNEIKGNCKFLLDAVNHKIFDNEKNEEIKVGWFRRKKKPFLVINKWNKEEMCGYWKIHTESRSIKNLICNKTKNV